LREQFQKLQAVGRPDSTGYGGELFEHCTFGILA
jgi:hypothetical protein